MKTIICLLLFSTLALAPGRDDSLEGAALQCEALDQDGAALGYWRQAVARNMYISKSDAKIVRIDPEKGQVYLELQEDLGNGKFRTVERVLEMHQTVEGQNP